MKLCDYCGIVYMDQSCPLCKATARISSLEGELESIEAEVREHVCESD